MHKLIYVLDPMCSWCWGFREALQEFTDSLEDHELTYVMGGLAKDSDDPMTDEMREYVRGAWQAVAARTGAEFNHAFWTTCRPRRSTYPACRAVLAAGLQDAKASMIEAIQRAYYLEARNPSDDDALIELAGEIGLDRERFAVDVTSPAVADLLRDDFKLRRELGVTRFPTLLLQRSDGCHVLTAGYATADDMRTAMRRT
ncbi:MAG: DsbA family protein [Verrucomicrobia bacterium]|nr:DsbA family protein [Verrucomicrobiota bacterium]MDA1086904.1 DsbA family protein [Verrucomicrobiota bacterium]